MTIIEATAGECAHNLINRGLIEARKELKDVMIKHNGIDVIISEKSYVNDICRIYDLKKHITQIKKNSF